MAEKQDAVKLLKEQKERLDRLRERRTRVAGVLGAKKQQYEDACAEGKREFGTDDLTELLAKVSETDASNDEVAMSFMLQLDDVEEQLAAVERQVNV
jgi:hypothetical protein